MTTTQHQGKIYSNAASEMKPVPVWISDRLVYLIFFSIFFIETCSRFLVGLSRIS
jgi:hypothetical protein